MKTARVLSAILVVVMLLSVAVVSCGPEEVAPPPTAPPPTAPPPTAPPPTAPPPVTPPPEVEQPKPHEIVTVDFYSGPAGQPSYQHGIVVSRMLEELHPWLRAKVVETLGSVDRIHTADALPPKWRGLACQFMQPSIQMTKCWLGEEPYKRKFTDLKWAGKINVAAFGFVTYNSEIRTPQDLIGKTVGVFPIGSGMLTLSDAILKDAWGIYDEVKISHHRPPAFKDVLLTGEVDAAFAMNATSLEGGKYSIGSAALSVLGARKTYWMDLTPEDIDRIKQNNPWNTSRLPVPKGEVGPASPPEDAGLMTFWSATAWWDEAPEEVVYELLKFLADNAEVYTRRLEGRPMSAEWLAAIPGATEDQLHPGALRFFRERGLKIGG